MSRVPDFIIERVHLGEATSEQRARVLASPEAQARLEALSEANTAFLEAHPAEEALPEIERRLHLARTRDAVAARRRRMATGGSLLVPAATAALALLLIAPPQVDPSGGTVIDPIDGEIRVKGLKPKLHVYHQDRGRASTLHGGQVLAEGDELQLAYTRGGASHGVLISIDGRGAVTLHAPDSADTTLLPGKHVIPHAYRLDDAPVFERFFLVTSDHPIDVDRVMSEAQHLAEGGSARDEDLNLPDDLLQQDLLIRKEAR